MQKVGYMGKTIKGIQRIKDKKYLFQAHIKVQGVIPHTEWYSISESHAARAKELGYFQDKSIYHDWKPLINSKFDGGVFEVSHMTTDDKYLYAHIGGSDKAAYSLPKYLRSSLPSESSILVGYREN